MFFSGEGSPEGPGALKDCCDVRAQFCF